MRASVTADPASGLIISDDSPGARIPGQARQPGTSEWWTEYDDIQPAWFAPYLGLEDSADIIRGFEFQFVPGLFQTEEYARAVIRLGNHAMPEPEVERRVALRLRRQDLLTRPAPPNIWMVVDEAVLRRAYGGSGIVMRAQLRHLVKVSRLRHVTLQAVPFSHGGHSGATGSFTVLRRRRADRPDVVYMEQLTDAVYLDRPEDVEHYREVADQLSSEALPPSATRDFIEQIAREAEERHP